jgi:2-polyprenyl-6-methoxyphenol hydroxylase-like FAD-dependent oxidoreductase
VPCHRCTPGTAALGPGDSVHPRSLEVFESLGILEPLLAAGVKQRMARLHSGGNVLGEIDLSVCGSRYGFNIGISEEVVESILTKYLHEKGGKVVRSARLIELEDHEDGLLATIEREGAAEQVLARWAVGCDGLHSTTGTLSGIELTGHDITGALGRLRCDLGGLAGLVRGELCLSGRHPGNPDPTSGTALACLPAAELRGLRPGGRRFIHDQSLPTRDRL